MRAATSRVREIVEAVRISAVYSTLTGRRPKPVGPDRWRAQATWRGGDGWSVALHDGRGVWKDFVSNEGGGVLDLVVRICSCSRGAALKWLAELAGVPIDREVLSPSVRAEWAQQRRRLERDLPAARHWKRVALPLCEEALSDAKDKFFSPASDIDVVALRDLTEMIERLERLDGAALVEEWRAFRDRHPDLGESMVTVGRARERAETRALRAFLDEMEA